MKNRTAWLIVAVLAALALGLGGVMWAMSSSRAAQDQLAVIEQENAALASRIDSLTAQVASANAAVEAAASAPTPTPTTPPVTTPATPKPKPSFVTYAYVTKLTGPYNETFTVHIDPFEILTDSAATAYATAHGQTPPSNGILLVNSSTKTSAYALAETAKITAYTGGVEVMTPKPIEPGTLQSWAADHSVIAGASSDMWQVTVSKGVIATIKMIAIAD